MEKLVGALEEVWSGWGLKRVSEWEEQGGRAGVGCGEKIGMLVEKRDLIV